MGTWEQFVQAVQKFDSFDYKHAIDGLIELQQTGSVRDYVDEFEALQFQITSRAEQNSFKNSVMSGTAAHEVFDEMLFEDDKQQWLNRLHSVLQEHPKLLHKWCSMRCV